MPDIPRHTHASASTILLHQPLDKTRIEATQRAMPHALLSLILLLMIYIVSIRLSRLLQPLTGW
jgi:hypothetical protein